MIRRRTEPTDTGPEIPEHLRVCITEDWLGPTQWPDIDPVVTAWGRWRRARRAWAIAHGIDPRSLPVSRPRTESTPGRTTRTWI